jgi:hypothetical protein
MGGGDLDGDCFFIIWDPDLVPTVEAPALNYSVSGNHTYHFYLNTVFPFRFVFLLKNHAKGFLNGFFFKLLYPI